MTRGEVAAVAASTAAGGLSGGTTLLEAALRQARAQLAYQSAAATLQETVSRVTGLGDVQKLEAAVHAVHAAAGGATAGSDRVQEILGCVRHENMMFRGTCCTSGTCGHACTLPADVCLGNTR